MSKLYTATTSSAFHNSAFHIINAAEKKDVVCAALNLAHDRSYVSSLGTLTSHSVQSAWIGILERRGIRWASLAETLRVKEERGLVGGGVSDEFAGWARRLVLKTRVSLRSQDEDDDA